MSDNYSNKEFAEAAAIIINRRFLDRGKVAKELAIAPTELDRFLDGYTDSIGQNVPPGIGLSPAMIGGLSYVLTQNDRPYALIINAQSPNRTSPSVTKVNKIKAATNGGDQEKDYSKTYAAAKEIDALPEVEKRDLFVRAILSCVNDSPINQKTIKNYYTINTLQTMWKTQILPTDAERMRDLGRLLKTTTNHRFVPSQIERAVNLLSETLLSPATFNTNNENSHYLTDDYSLLLAKHKPPSFSEIANKIPMTKTILDLSQHLRGDPQSKDILAQLANKYRTLSERFDPATKPRYVKQCQYTTAICDALCERLPDDEGELYQLIEKLYPEISELTGSKRVQEEIINAFTRILRLLQETEEHINHAMLVSDPIPDKIKKAIDRLQGTGGTTQHKIKNIHIVEALQYMTENGIPPTDQEGFSKYIAKAKEHFRQDNNHNRILYLMDNFFIGAMEEIGINLAFTPQKAGRCVKS